MDGETRLAGMGQELPKHFQGPGPLDTPRKQLQRLGLPCGSAVKKASTAV